MSEISWRCPYCHDQMNRRMRRNHLRLEWMRRRVSRSDWARELH